MTCSVCGRTFAYPRHLAIHGTTHDQDRSAAMFWSKVDRTDACWEWQGARDEHGYGHLRRASRYVSAYRFAWELVNGPIPDGMSILHRCDNPPCVNPDHLFLGTHADNMADMVAKGRSARGDRNGVRRHPDRLARGGRHGTKTHPESVVRGSRHPGAKLTEEVVPIIRARIAAGATYRRVAEDYGVTERCVRDVFNRRRWKHVA